MIEWSRWLYIYIWGYVVLSYIPLPIYILYFSFFAHSFSHHHCPARATVATRAPLGNSYEFFSCIRDRNELQLTKYKLYRFATSNHRQQYSPHTQGSRKCFTLCSYKDIISTWGAEIHIAWRDNASFFLGIFSEFNIFTYIYDEFVFLLFSQGFWLTESMCDVR